MTNCTCQPDGSCEGTPLANTTSCNDGNPCTTGDYCDGAGSCVGGGTAPSTTGCDDHNDCTTGDHCDGAGKCTHDGTKDPDAECTLPGSGLCQGTCQGYGSHLFCVPDCGLDLCHQCDQSTGQCTMNECGLIPCTTGQCDESGDCIPGNEGGPCDDYDVCTSNDHCESGKCVGSAGGTPQPTVTPGLTGCVGDCNNNSVVTADEILTAINIALGNLDVSACENADANDDGVVTVDEILAAVNAALNGCPQIPPSATPASLTATPTRTPTSSGGTPPPTGVSTPSIGTRASGMIQSTTSAFLVIPNLLSALLGHLPAAGSGSGAMTLFSTPFDCNSGGGTLACDQDVIIFPASVGPPTYTVTLDNCQVTGSTGALTFNGTLTATGQEGDYCGTIPSDVEVSIPSLTVQTPAGTATFTNFIASVSLSCSTGSCSCYYDTAELLPVGTITVTGTNTNGEVTFQNGSSVVVSVLAYFAQCVPTVYDMEVNGYVILTTNNSVLPAIYDAYTIHDDASSGRDMVKVYGDITSPACFPGTVTFSTPADIALGNPCPSAGVVDAYADTSGNTDVITYSSSGVHIDFGAGGSADFPTCLYGMLYVCPGG